MKYHAALICLCVCLFVACGPKGSSLSTEYVEGLVTLDGVPLDEAVVTFQPTASGGVPATGYSDANGIYKLTSVGGDPQKGAVAGEYNVLVNKVKIEMVLGAPSAPGDEPQETAKQTPLLHKNYSRADSTPLKVTVSKGKNSIDLPLTKGGT